MKESDEGNMEEIEDDASSEEENNIQAGVKRKRGRPKLERTGNRSRPRKIQMFQNPELLNGLTLLNKDPQTVQQAMESENADLWKEAMQAEFNALQSNNTWKLVEKPNNKNIIGCKWVFGTKTNSSGNIEKYKARLVAQGFSQKYNVDYTDTYSPVAAQKKMLLNHIDVVSAFLNGELQEEVYMQQPQMFADKHYPDLVCKLKRSLYGLKQAGRDWYRKINQILIDNEHSL